MDWKPFSADASLSLYFSDMVRDTSDVPHGQVRQCFDSHEHSHDDLANIHIPVSELRDMLRVAIATAIQDRDIPHDGDKSEEEAEMADGDIDGVRTRQSEVCWGTRKRACLGGMGQHRQTGWNGRIGQDGGSHVLRDLGPNKTQVIREGNLRSGVYLAGSGMSHRLASQEVIERHVRL
ncbi:uncharacterized protein CCOS01_01327 [Colletotrichum costaricense]|uniref:Uncharacterized protein n=1 Tax=Colletotrichum costaricense TaxID=1209916 RepID=A0AAI9ZAP9_9PEZI|nr:uncharacterized protein CCOS01_01327 [Colletotrichum costaricense]KAK1540013.1 hypothetical protein CCOS01_01327 [Colletotrichum costaricense]